MNLNFSCKLRDKKILIPGIVCPRNVDHDTGNEELDYYWSDIENHNKSFLKLDNDKIILSLLCFTKYPTTKLPNVLKAHSD